MKRLHYFSGLVLTLFIGLHLFNHVLGILGPEKHIAWMHAFRFVYRSLLGETILLSVVAIQVVSGINLYRSKRTGTHSLFEKIHIWSGLYLAFFLLIHVSAVLAGRFLFQLDTNFYFGVAGLNSFPFNLFFIPYYTCAILAFFGHVAAVHHQKMKREILGYSPETQAKMLLLIGFCFSLFLLFALTNGFQGVEIPKEYNVLIGR